MVGIVVGCNLAAVLPAPGTQTFPPPPPPPVQQITAVLMPAASALYAGQSLQDMTGYAQMTQAANFRSEGASIVDVAVSATGQASSDSAPLSEGMQVGFSVTVTDSAGSVEVFTTQQITVDYQLRLNMTADNEVSIDINPMVPDAVPVSITLSGGTGYDGTYTPTAAQIRNNVYNFPGTVRVAYAGPLADLGAGDVMTHDKGLWSSPTGTLVITGQAQRDGVDISGATGPSYTLSGADEGTDYTLAVTGDDGMNPPVTVQSPAISIPVPAVAPAGIVPVLAQTHLDGTVDASDATLYRVPFDYGAQAPGTPIVIMLNARAVTNRIVSARLMSADASDTALSLIGSTDARNNAMAFSGVVPASRTGHIELTFNGSASIDAISGGTYVVPGASGYVATTGIVLAANPCTVTADEVASGAMIVLAAEDRGTGGITVAGIDTGNQVTVVPTSSATYSTVLNFAEITSGAPGVTYTGTMAGNGHAAMIAVMVT